MCPSWSRSRDRLGPERREQWGEGALRLERAERGHVEIGDPAGERGDARARTESVVAQRAREPVGARGQHRIGQVDRRLDVGAVTADPLDRDVVTAPGPHMAVEGEVGDVDAVLGVGSATEIVPGVVPVERSDGRLVVDEPGIDGRPRVHGENCSSARMAWVAYVDAGPPPMRRATPIASWACSGVAPARNASCMCSAMQSSQRLHDGDRHRHQLLGGLRQGAVGDRGTVQVAEALHLRGDRSHEISVALSEFGTVGREVLNAHGTHGG